MSVERARIYALIPYIRHIGNCGAVDSDDPMDARCICALRLVWAKNILSQPPCKSCDLSMGWHDCVVCGGEGGEWVCVNKECPE